VFAELAALAAALGTVAAYRGAILAMLALGAATTIATVAIAALLPFTTDLIGAVGQNLPLNCGGQPACELPPFNHTEDTARTLMQVAAAAGALAAAAATATGLRRQRFEDLV
jgi:hypothetical protein